MDHSPGSYRRHLLSGFLRNARAAPDRPALLVGGRTYSYGEALHIARSWAGRLLDAGGEGGRPPERIGILGLRSEESFLGVLAALIAGAAFVPLHPRFPLARTRGMVGSAELDAIIADPTGAAILGSIIGGGGPLPVVLAPRVDAQPLRAALPAGCRVLGRSEFGADPGGVSPRPVAPDDVAYLLFTSGSTGQPKGVPITHANVRAFLDFNIPRYRLEPADRCTQLFEQTFDLSVFDLFMAWESGACVCVIEPLELLGAPRVLEKRGISVWFSVPSAAKLLLARGLLRPRAFPTLRWSLFCGESLPRDVAEAWSAAAANSVVENLYGPTELTIACSVYRWDPVRSPAECLYDRVPIGAVYPDLPHMVVDGALGEVGDGDTGELCVGGAQVTPGYWRAPELTAARFFTRPAPAGIPGASVGDPVRFYRTGDLVRRMDGQYVFVGRTDQQVKIAGYRIELGEVESALRRVGWADAVALPWPDAQRAEAIVVVVTTPDGAGNGAPPRVVDGAAEQLRGHLPPFMLPRHVLGIGSMPLNSNGKIDRGALAATVAAGLAGPGPGPGPGPGSGPGPAG